MKRLILFSIIVLVAAIAQAHEFWMQPQKFFFSVGEKASLSLVVGENFIAGPWTLKKEKLQTLMQYGTTSSQDLKSVVKEGEKDQLEVPLTEEGTQMIVMQSTNSFVELDGAAFNAYLKEDGLDEAYDYRERNNQLEKVGREFYSRHCKLLLQVGTKASDVYKKVMGWPIEIVPEKNPYEVKKGEMMRFRILAKGKPLFSARVKVWNRKDNRTTLQNIYTDKEGWIETRVSNGGPWMVSVVTMERLSDSQADWQSYWGSLVFGVK